MRYAVKFAYDGRNFHGYARQPNIKTVEGKIIEILENFDIINNPKESLFRSASRTDKGVSAISNVVAFNSDKSKDYIFEKISKQVNLIIFYAIKEVNDDFNPRYAKLRQYSYYLKNENLDSKKIISSSRFFTGVHNFTNFARVEDYKNPFRTIDNILFTIDKKYIIIDFFAQSYLWQQIRRIVSSLIKIEKEKITDKEIIDALDYPQRRIDYGVADPKYLILKEISYSFDFEIENKNLDKIKNFEEKILNF